MIRINRRPAPYWRLAALLPVMMAAVLSIIGTGGGSSSSSDSLIDCGPDEVSNRNVSEQEPFSFDIAVVNHSELRLQGKSGNISVTGVPGATSVMVTGVKSVRSDSVQDAQAHLQQLKVNIQDLANEALVETTQPQCTKGRDYIVDYTITVPKFFAVLINNLNGIVTLDLLDDDVSVNNLNGTVTITNTAGSVGINLLTGDIVAGIISLPLNGTIELNILSGNISLEIPANMSAEFSAVVFNGNIDVSNLVLQNEVITPTSVRGTLGGGQGNILLETEVVGDIDVSGI